MDTWHRAFHVLYSVRGLDGVIWRHFVHLYLAFGEDKEAAPATWADALTKQEYVLIGCEDTDIPTDDGVIRRLQEPTGAKCEF